MNHATDQQRREQGRERSDAYRERRRHGRILVSLEVGPRQLAALERLALLDTGERDKTCIAWPSPGFLIRRRTSRHWGIRCGPLAKKKARMRNAKPDNRRDIGHSGARSHNAPFGWAAFREFRQEPNPIPCRRHGNRKHGRYSKSSMVGMRFTRICVSIVRGRVGTFLDPGFARPDPPGWRAFRGTRIKRIKHT